MIELLRLADIALLPRQEQIARKLLRNRRPARDDLPARLVLLPGLQNRVGFVAVVVGEVRILRRDDRALQIARNLVVGNPGLLRIDRSGRSCLEPPRVGAHERRRRRIHELPDADLHEVTRSCVASNAMPSTETPYTIQRAGPRRTAGRVLVILGKSARFRSVSAVAVSNLAQFAQHRRRRRAARRATRRTIPPPARPASRDHRPRARRALARAA